MDTQKTREKPQEKPLPIGVLVSGSGSLLQAILDSIRKKHLHAQVRLVVSNEPDAFAIERARRAKVPSLTLPHRAFAQRQDYDQALVEAFQASGAQWIVLAGFLRLLTPTFLDAFPSRVINIHPALLPSFPGLDAQQQALDYGARVTGCTIHFVDTGMDTGPIIAQSVVDIRQKDTRDSLAKRVIQREHKLLPTVLQWIAEGRVQVNTQGPEKRPTVHVHGNRCCFGVAGAR